MRIESFLPPLGSPDAQISNRLGHPDRRRGILSRSLPTRSRGVVRGSSKTYSCREGIRAEGRHFGTFIVIFSILEHLEDHD